LEPGATSGRLRLLAWPISLVTAFLPVKIIRQTALFEAGAILRLGGKCRGVALKARLAGVDNCSDSSCDSSTSTEQMVHFDFETIRN